MSKGEAEGEGGSLAAAEHFRTQVFRERERVGDIQWYMWIALLTTFRPSQMGYVSQHATICTGILVISAQHNPLAHGRWSSLWAHCGRHAPGWSLPLRSARVMVDEVVAAMGGVPTLPAKVCVHGEGEFQCTVIPPNKCHLVCSQWFTTYHILQQAMITQ